MKVVINKCYGGFCLSKKAVEYMASLGNKEAIVALTENHGYISEENRSNPDLVSAVEFLGSKSASGFCSELSVVDVPDGINWHIAEYDGKEHVARNHETWS